MLACAQSFVASGSSRRADEPDPHLVSSVNPLSDKDNLRQSGSARGPQSRPEVQHLALSQRQIADETGAVAADIAHLHLGDFLAAVNPPWAPVGPSAPAATLLRGGDRPRGEEGLRFGNGWGIEAHHIRNIDWLLSHVEGTEQIGHVRKGVGK